MFSEVSPLVWALTALGFVAIVVLDLVVIARRKEAVTMKQATGWVVFYVALAALFAAGLFLFRAPGHRAASSSPGTSPSTA